MNQPWNVVVAGAGPAGSSAAHLLARKGKTVLMVDPVEASSKFGDTLPGAAVRLLRSIDLPIPTPEDGHALIGGNCSSWDSDTLTAVDFINDPDGPGWRLDRPRFDERLRAGAIHSGARLHLGQIQEMKRLPNMWRIKLSDGSEVFAEWMLDATGRHSVVARHAGARRLRDSPLIGLYAFGKTGRGLRSTRTYVEAAANGWWYAATTPSGASVVGFHCCPDTSAQFKREPDFWWAALRKSHHVQAFLVDDEPGSPLMAIDATGGRLDHFAGDGWFACGDAALSFDPLLGQGIFSALYGGILVSRALLSALARDDHGVLEYEARLELMRSGYLSDKRRLYRSETRWSTEPFWCRVFRPLEDGDGL